MIKPSDLKNLARDNTAALAAIEEWIDKAIRHHAANPTQTGPITVRTTRSGWAEDEIATVLDRYRAAGWTVHAGGRSGNVMCTLEPAEPERQYAPIGGS